MMTDPKPFFHVRGRDAQGSVRWYEMAYDRKRAQDVANEAAREHPHLKFSVCVGG